jgi:hypothetical protein
MISAVRPNALQSTKVVSSSAALKAWSCSRARPAL